MKAVPPSDRVQQLSSISRVLVGFSSLASVLRKTFEHARAATPLASIVVIERAAEAMQISTYPETVHRGVLAHARNTYDYLTDDVQWGALPDQRPYVVVPLVVPGGAIFGVIQFEGAAPLEHTDVEFLNAIGNQLAIAIDRDRSAKLAAIRISDQLDFTRAIAASLGEGVIAVDRDANVTFMNPAAEELAGADEASTLGTSVDLLGHFEVTGNRVACPLRGSIESGTSVQSDDHVLRRADGHHFEASYTSSPIRRGGEIVGAVLVFKDIHARKRAERDRAFLLDAGVRLAASLEADAVLAELARVAVQLGEVCFVDVLTTDDHALRVAWAHRDADRMADLEAEYRATPAVEIVASNFGKVRASEHVLRVPLAIGDRVLGALTIESGKERSYDGVDRALVEELARRGAIALEHARLYARARDAIGLRDQMLAIVSHDLRSPLSIVTMAAGNLEDSCTSDATRATVQKINRAAQRMDRMIRDLLDYAAIDAGHLSITKRVHDVQSIISETLVGVEAIARVRNIELAMVIPEELPPVACDRDRILQVTSNLVGNALKVVSAGGLVMVRAESRGDEIVISVIDTGPGISEHDQNWLFERYWRGAQRYQGTGLGLAISRGIVLAHGGTIWVESKLGQGATFSFTLPVARRTRAAPLGVEARPEP